MPLDPKNDSIKQLFITSSAAAHDAAQVLAEMVTPEADTDAVVADFRQLHEAFLSTVIDGVDRLVEELDIQIVQAAFPGAQVVPAPDAGPAPLPGVQVDPKDALWADLINSPSNWYNNRGNKRNPKGPDFKHKSSGEALWLDKKAPEFARQYFGV